MNHVNVWRMEHSSLFYNDLKEPVGMGPYTYVSRYHQQVPEPQIPPVVKALSERLYNNEERPRYLKKNIAPGKALPASASYLRPGPREDVGLREYFRDYYLGGNINGSKMVVDDPFVFCFDSIGQSYRWFFDMKEWELLEANGFILKKRRIPVKSSVLGHAQGIIKTKDWVKIDPKTVVTA